MASISLGNLQTLAISMPPKLTTSSSFYKPSISLYEISFQFRRYKPPETAIHARKKDPKPQPVLKPSIVEEVSTEDEEDQEGQFLFEELEDDAIEGEDGDYFEEDDEYVEEDEAELYAGDGEGGGGVSLAGTWWDKKALTLAEDVCLSFGGELGIYAFKTLANLTVQVRVELLTNK